MSRPTLRRLVSVAAMSALAFGVLPAGSALAEPRDIEEFACPSADVPDPGFSDDNGHFAEPAIHCIVWYDLAQGTTSSTYSPDALVGRGAMAKFIANVLTAGGVELPTDPEDAFTDDDESDFELFINQLAELEVVEGTTETTYEPAARVSRAQMASFLARAYEEIAGAELPAGENAFTDDDGTFHEPNINRVAAAGIAAGTTETTYSPGNPVKRGQMAAFLARLLDLLVEEGFADVPRTEADNETALDVPELLRVEPVSATTVRFVFDETLNATVTGASFGLYSFDATRTQATATQRSGTDSVLATFPADAVESAVLGAVAAGAVQADDDASPSIEGWAALDDVDLDAGTTVAPDLRTVTVSGTSGTFVFDEPAFNVTTTGYHLVLTDGTDLASADAAPQGEGTESHTVTFTYPEGKSATDVAYGYVDDGTVSDADTDGNENVLHEEHVSASGQTERPDLTAFEVIDATTARYTFDENVSRTPADPPLPGNPAPGAFRVYFTDGSTATAESSTKPTNNTFVATFEEGALSQFVAGGIVDAETVTGANGTNQPQELGVALSFDAGDTAAPELVSATIGTPEGSENRVVRYVFDDEVDTVVNGSRFKLYTQDGTARAFTAGTALPPSDGSCTVDSEDATVVNCVLSGTGADGEFLVAVVERNAVTSDGGYQNPEGFSVLAPTAA